MQCKVHVCRYNWMNCIQKFDPEENVIWFFLKTHFFLTLWLKILFQAKINKLFDILNIAWFLWSWYALHFALFQRYDYETENLQSLALQLGCKARSLFNEVQPRNLENDPNMANHSHSSRSRPHQLSVEILSSVADLIITLKCVIQWLDR